MVRVRCPKCRGILSVAESEDPHRVRCLRCGAIFIAISTAHQAEIDPDTDPQAEPEAGLGWFVKALLAGLGAGGMVLFGFLLYTVAGSGRPAGETGSPASQVARSVAPGEAEARSGQLKTTPSGAKDARPAVKTESPSARGVPGKTPNPSPAGHARPSAPASVVALSPQDLFAAASPAVVRVTVMDKDLAPIGQGSGFFVSPDGLLITNHHVIRGAHFATVKLPTNATLFVDSVLGVDPNADLALLKVNGTGLPFLRVSGSGMPEVGTRVYAIGNPAGLANTLSEGLISGIRKDEKGRLFLQTNAAISKGSSGGPLVAADGKVVGVTSFYLTGAQNLNFAVPAAKVTGLLTGPRTAQTLASAGGKPLDEAATRKLGEAYMAMGLKDWASAARILTELRKTDSENPSVWYALGNLHTLLGNHEIAVDHYKVVIRLKPDHVDAYFLMAHGLACLKRDAEAIAAYRTLIAIDPANAEAYFHMGNCHVRLKEDDQAIAAFEKAVRVRPNYAEAYEFLGTLYRILERYAEAIAALEKARGAYAYEAKTYHLNRDAKVFRVLYLMAGAYLSAERYDEAVATAAKAVAVYEVGEERVGGGPTYVPTDREFAAAIAAKEGWTDNPLGLDPNEAFSVGEGYRVMGTAHLEARRHTEGIRAIEKAIDAYKITLRSAPGRADAYHGMGSAYQAIAKWADCVAAYEQCLRLDPTGPTAHFVRDVLPTLRRLRDR